MSFTLAEMAEATGGRLSGPAELVLERLVTDSRDAGPGAMFVALKGESSDGHRFVDDALSRGAAAVLMAEATSAGAPTVLVPDTREALRDFTRQRLKSQRVRVIAITGSVGKTSTKEMVAAVAARRYQVLKTEGNLNTYTGLPITVARLEHGHQLLVAEYAMSARGEIAYLTEMAPPDIAVVLNVGWSHVGLLGSLDDVAGAKRELVEALTDEGEAILNADDARVAAMAASCRGTVAYFSLAGATAALARATSVELGGLSGSQFVLQLPDGQARVLLQVPGKHAIANALAAATTGHVLGVAVDEVARALESCRPPQGRMAIRPGRRSSTVIDDSYNASPASMEAALAVLLAEKEKPRIAVLGDMLELGQLAHEAHVRVGSHAASADLLVVMGEHAGALREGALAVGMPPDRIHLARDLAEAVRAVEPYLDGAVVLVKASRGMALEGVVAQLLAEGQEAPPDQGEGTLH